MSHKNDNNDKNDGYDGNDKDDKDDILVDKGKTKRSRKIVNRKYEVKSELMKGEIGKESVEYVDLLFNILKHIQMQNLLYLCKKTKDNESVVTTMRVELDSQLKRIFRIETSKKKNIYYHELHKYIFTSML